VGTNIVGKWWSFWLGLVSFPYDGYGVKSALVAILDTKSNADYFTNSVMSEVAHSLIGFCPNALRDFMFLPYATMIMLGQKSGATVASRPSSPESYNETLQESLYNWSHKTVREYL
jgi:hypothetical protein